MVALATTVALLRVSPGMRSSKTWAGSSTGREQFVVVLGSMVAESIHLHCMHARARGSPVPIVPRGVCVTFELEPDASGVHLA
jgi:hypothetical protein